MHLLAIPLLVLVLAALVFGKSGAQVVAGALLSLIAGGVLLLLSVAAIDIARQDRAAQAIHMGHSR